MRALLLAALVLLVCSPAAARAAAWTARAPGGEVSATVTHRGGELAVTARRGGRVVVTAALGRAPRPAGARRDRISDAFATPMGKRRAHRLEATRLRLGGLELLVADDGIAFRGRPGATWHAPRGTRAWLQDWRANYENPYRPGVLAGAPAGDRGYPALLRTPADDYALLTESGLPYGAPAGRLRLRHGALATVPAAAGPWRVAVLGTAATVVETDLPLALGRPSEIADQSWIRPGRAAWSWWADSWSPRRLADQLGHAEHAARAGWEYVLVDEGWRAAWVPDLVRHAGGLGVRVLLWADWRDLDTARERARRLGDWAAWGVAGVKVDFLESDSAERMRFMEDVARAAARRRLVVNFHGATVPRGFQRTWPNALTFEAVRGAEHARDGAALNPEHGVDLVFTRNAIGSMDYTPVVLAARGQATTPAHRLAQAIAYESGLQHHADPPRAFDGHPEALALLSAVPAAWDDTRLLAGAPGEHATVARRSGDAWFVGALSATGPRTEDVALSFLDADRAYTARVLSDDGAGGIAVREQPVRATDTLAIPVATGGGFALAITPAG